MFSGKLIEELCNHSQYDVAYATGCWKKSALYKLNAANILFDNIPLGHADYHYNRALITKEAIQLATIQYQRKWDYIVYIGDGIWDAKTTDQLGIPFIGVDYLQDGKLRSYGIKIIVEHYESVEIFESYLNEAITNFKNKDKYGLL